MREIKFRAWNKEDKKMRYKVEYMFGFSGGFPYYDYILMQYTGLKDKNGVDIYEGDIVTGDRGYISPVKGVVKYGALAFAFVGKSEKGDYWFDTITNPDFKECSRIEVIGNIHENPELLGE